MRRVRTLGYEVFTSGDWLCVDASSDHDGKVVCTSVAVVGEGLWSSRTDWLLLKKVTVAQAAGLGRQIEPE